MDPGIIVGIVLGVTTLLIFSGGGLGSFVFTPMCAAFNASIVVLVAKKNGVLYAQIPHLILLVPALVSSVFLGERVNILALAIFISLPSVSFSLLGLGIKQFGRLCSTTGKDLF
ncbi:hypothetical protein JYT83_00905 [bacterium AH-315-F18]|nr:hypothetical protein [bacterium AH-315-F18]